MTDILQQNLDDIERTGAAAQLAFIRRGLEKESLRVSPDGVLAATPHPQQLGAALTHQLITTDYSESLLEFITPVFDSVNGMLEFLSDLHVFAYRNIGDEMLWTSSMPCILHGDDSIPISDYGRSNIGFMKHVYRRGLGLRYGRLMQTIAGIHYNFSLPDEFFSHWLGTDSQAARSARYFDLLRNFHRHCWLVLYLFGSAPAVCRTFVEGRDHTLTPFGKNSFYLPHGTTLRMSRLGYQNSAQSDIHIRTDSVEEYARSLRAATERSYPPYELLGVIRNGEYQQLNTNLLQIENEFYTVIRPKRTIRPLEKPTCALMNRGVEYVEVRSIDLDPMEPIGISADTIHFMDAFLLYCLLQPSPQIGRDEEEEIGFNRDITVTQGRAEGTSLYLDGKRRTFRDAAHRLLDGIGKTAAILDHYTDAGHRRVVDEQRHKVDHPEDTPSARIVEEMRGLYSYFACAMRSAERHRRHFTDHALAPKREADFSREVTRSLEQARTLEAEPQQPFNEFLAGYFAGGD